MTGRSRILAAAVVALSAVAAAPTALALHAPAAASTPAHVAGTSSPTLDQRDSRLGPKYVAVKTAPAHASTPAATAVSAQSTGFTHWRLLVGIIAGLAVLFVSYWTLRRRGVPESVPTEG